jgi:hypothetical protein
MSEEHNQTYAVPSGSIAEYRYTVYFENLALWREQDPLRRMNIAQQLADWTATLAAMEAEEVRKSQLQAKSQDEAA